LLVLQGLGFGGPAVRTQLDRGLVRTGLAGRGLQARNVRRSFAQLGEPRLQRQEARPIQGDNQAVDLQGKGSARGYVEGIIVSGTRLQRLRHVWHRLLHRENGQGLVEYALLVTLVSVASITALGFFSGKIQALYGDLFTGVNHVAQPASGTGGTFQLPPQGGGFQGALCNFVIGLGSNQISFSYYPAGVVYPPGTAQSPQGFEGMYVPQSQQGELSSLIALGCNVPTSFDIDGYSFDCNWSFGAWQTPGGASFGAACQVTPTMSVTLAPSGQVTLGTTLTATASGYPSATNYTWRWYRNNSTNCASGTYTLWDTNNTGGNTNTDTPGAGDGNRCYQVTVVAGGIGGTTPESSPSNQVLVNTPAAPTGGTISLAPGTGTIPETLTATTGSWNNNPTSYTYRWYRNNSTNCGTGTYTLFDTNAGITTTTNTENLNAAGDARCYQVTVTATNLGGTSPVVGPSNQAQATLPAAPIPGTVSIAPIGGGQAPITLTATTIGWTGGAPTSYTYRWYRNSSTTCGTGPYTLYDTNAGVTTTTNAENIPGNGGGRCYQVTVTATNIGGTGGPTPASNNVLVTALLPPVLVTNGTITGSPLVVGTTLSMSNGVWNPNTGLTYTYNWRRSNGGAPCTFPGFGSIGTGQTYTLQAADGGHCVEVAVTATNAAGGTTAPYVVTGLVPTPPTNTAAPVVSVQGGLPLNQGNTLQTTNGTWNQNGGGAITFAWQWQRCTGFVFGNNCSNGWQNIGSNQNTYVMTAADHNARIMVVVSATNANGTGTANSNVTGTVN